MTSYLQSIKKNLPDPIVSILKIPLHTTRRIKTIIICICDLILKKTYQTILFVFPKGKWTYEKILTLLNRNRSYNPLKISREFLFYFHKYFKICPESILDWRITVYWAYLIIHNTHGMHRMMKKFLHIQKTFKEIHQLDTLNISISSDNLFSNYNVHGYLDTHVKARMLGLHPNTKILLFLKSMDTVANPVMLSYWKKYITVINDDFAIKTLRPFKNYLQEDFAFTAIINDNPIYIEHAKYVVQKEWEKEGRKPLFELTTEDKNFGWDQLAKVGISRDTWFVSLHVRDAGYKLGSHLANDEYDSYRNADIDNYKLAIQSIVSAGGFVIRVGDPKMKKIPPMEGVFDYAYSDIRSNRMDIFLFSQCRFFVGVSSGPILNPILFGVPTIMTNFMPISGRPHASNCLFIPKHLWLKNENRYASFEEILSTDLGRIFTSHGYEKKGVKIVENSPEELNDVVTEMLERLSDNVSYSGEDEKMQEKLNELYRKYSGYGDLGRIGREFIKNSFKKGLI